MLSDEHALAALPTSARAMRTSAGSLVESQVESSCRPGANKQLPPLRRLGAARSNMSSARFESSTRGLKSGRFADRAVRGFLNQQGAKGVVSESSSHVSSSTCFPDADSEITNEDTCTPLPPHTPQSPSKASWAVPTEEPPKLERGKSSRERTSLLCFGSADISSIETRETAGATPPAEHRSVNARASLSETRSSRLSPGLMDQPLAGLKTAFRKSKARFSCSDTATRSKPLDATIKRKDTTFASPEEAVKNWERRMSECGNRRSLQFKPMKKPLSERMKKLDILRSGRVRRIRYERHLELKRRRFVALPEEESEMYQNAFEQIDIHHTGTVSRDEAFECLKELGLSGQTGVERLSVKATLSEISVFTLEEAEACTAPFNLYDFALTVVPTVRQKLIDLRSNDMFKQFYQFDTDGSGKLSRGECVELTRVMGLDTRMLDFGKLGPVGEEVEFEHFQELVSDCQQQLVRAVRDRERVIQTTTATNASVFNIFRDDIIVMHNIFVRYDKDDSGALCIDEVEAMLREFGLMTKSVQERDEIRRILHNNDADGDGEFSFSEFLELVRAFRQYLQDKKHDEQLACFEKYDKDKNGSLGAHEISILLADLGLMPKNRAEQDELVYLMNSVDTDASGNVQFSEFQLLCQRVDEKLKCLRYETEVAHAINSGFSEKRMLDIRFIFETIDADGSGKLDASEVRTALTMMRKDISNDTFEKAFSTLDADNSGHLNFLEFLGFLQLMRDGEGIFAEEIQRLQHCVELMDVRILRRVLEVFRLSKMYVQSLSPEDVVSLCCDYLGVSPSTNVHEVLECKTVGELLAFAKRRDEQMMASPQ